METYIFFVESDEILTHSISEQCSSQSQLSLDVTISTINQALALLNESPIDVKRKNDESYLSKRADDLAYNVKKMLGVTDPSLLSRDFNSTDAYNIIMRLKSKFNDDETSYAERIQILTIMPTNWSINKISEIMGSSVHITKIANKLETKSGILSIRGPKTGKNKKLKSKHVFSKLISDHKRNNNLI